MVANTGEITRIRWLDLALGRTQPTEYSTNSVGLSGVAAGYQKGPGIAMMRMGEDVRLATLRARPDRRPDETHKPRRYLPRAVECVVDYGVTALEQGTSEWNRRIVIAELESMLCILTKEDVFARFTPRGQEVIAAANDRFSPYRG